MMNQTTLGKLTQKELQACPAWAVLGDMFAQDDPVIEPVRFDENGQIASDVGEVWCLCEATFADKTKYSAGAWCCGNTTEGPSVWEICNGEWGMRLCVPPAPHFVLEREGPEVLAAAFGKKVEEVFPMTITAVPRFAKEPHIRSVRIATTGIIP